jgi:hypothetical protein
MKKANEVRGFRGTSAIDLQYKIKEYASYLALSPISVSLAYESQTSTPDGEALCEALVVFERIEVEGV